MIRRKIVVLVVILCGVQVNFCCLCSIRFSFWQYRESPHKLVSRVECRLVNLPCTTTSNLLEKRGRKKRRVTLLAGFFKERGWNGYVWKEKFGFFFKVDAFFDTLLSPPHEIKTACPGQALKLATQLLILVCSDRGKWVGSHVSSPHATSRISISAGFPLM